MFIQTEPTPNPDTLKFYPGRAILPQGTADFDDPAKADNSPLAKHLFNVPDVQRIFFAADFISITKTPEATWDFLKPHLLTAIMEHFVAGLPVMDGDSSAATYDPNEINDDDDEIVIQIKQLLNTRVRPAVAQDGGDIVFDRFEDGIVYLHMQGSCSGCPSSGATLKSGIENMMRHYIPEVEEVRQSF